MIYFDNSATTYPKPECVYEALDYANRQLAFNAGRGNYKESLLNTSIIEKTRESIASFVNANPNNVTFFSSATESLNIIINGLDLNRGDTVYISPFEHNAIIRPLFNLKAEIGIEVLLLPFDKSTWKPNIEKTEEMFSIKKPKALFVSQVSNVTGLEIDYEVIFEVSKKYQCINILDSAQAFGIINPSLTHCDFCVFAGHKSLYSSFGVAGFINYNNLSLKITKSGGTGSDSLNHYMPPKSHERYEAGTPNIVAIYSLLRSTEWIKNNDLYTNELMLTKYAINRLSSLKKILLYLPESREIFGIVSFNVRGYLTEDVAYILDEEYNIKVRSGYHCSPFVHDFIESVDFKGTIRISFGAFNTTKEIDILVSALKTL